MKKIESRRLLSLVTKVAHLPDDVPEALEALGDAEARPEEAADVETLREMIEDARQLFIDHHAALRVARKRRDAAKQNRVHFGTGLEQRADRYAIQQVGRARNGYLPNGTVSPISWLLANPEERAWPSDEEFEPDFFGALSAAYQAGFRAGRKG